MPKPLPLIDATLPLCCAPLGQPTADAAADAAEIAALARDKRQVIRLASPILPAGAVEPDTRWWWH